MTYQLECLVFLILFKSSPVLPAVHRRRQVRLLLKGTLAGPLKFFTAICVVPRMQCSDQLSVAACSPPPPPSPPPPRYVLWVAK